MGLRLEVDRTLIAFYRTDTGKKLLIPDELYEEAAQLQLRSQQLQAELDAERATREALQQQLDRYREKFGEL